MIKTPMTLDEGQQNDLFLLAKSGEKDARHKLILSLVKNAQRIALNSHRREPAVLLDELEAEALYLLTISIDSAINSNDFVVTDNGIAKYVSTYVSTNLYKYVYVTRRNRKMPASWKQRKNREVVVDFDEEGWKDESHNEMLIDKKNLFREEIKDLTEVITSCITTSLELECFKLSLLGYDNVEIATALEIPHYRLVLIKRNLRHKFQSKMENENEKA